MSYSRKIKLTIVQVFSDACLLSVFSLIFSISAHSLPLDILPLPNEVAFPKGGSSFEDSLLRPWYDAINDAGLAVGSQLSDDSKRLGITVWDVVNAREIGNALIDLNLAHPDNNSYAIRSAISISDSSRLLVIVSAYHFPTKKDELLAYHGKIDSLVQLSIPVSEFSSVTLTTAALSGERLIVFKKGEFTNDNVISSPFWVSPDASFTQANLNFLPEFLHPMNNKFYFVDRQFNSKLKGFLQDFRVFDRSGGAQVASYTSSSYPIAISKELSVLSLGISGKLSLHSLAKPSKPTTVAQHFSQASSVNTVPGLGFALTTFEPVRSRAIFISNEGSVRDVNCLLPRADTDIAAPLRKLKINGFQASSNSYYLASGEYSKDSSSPLANQFLVRPDFSQKFDNYCARLIIKPLGSCASSYEKQASSNNSYYLKSDAKLSNSCQYEIKLTSENRASLIPASIKIVGNKGRKISTKRLTLSSGKGRITLSPKDFEYVNISAIPLKKRSPYSGSSAAISLTR